MPLLSVIAFAMVATFMTLIMTKRLSPLIALILVPTAFAVASGFWAGLGEMMIQGVRDLAPTGVMLLFAILYFGVMIDAGLFDPLTRRIIRVVQGDPVRILVGTAVLALTVSLDGDGTTTYMITISALLPLYVKMRLDPLKLTCIAIMASAVTNLAPWGGPTARAATALKLDPSAVFMPLLPAMATLALWVVFVAWIFGRAERRRLANARPAPGPEEPFIPDEAADPLAAGEIRRPRLIWFNLALTAVLMAFLIAGVLPLAILFMLAFAIAIMVNYPTLEQQRARLGAHAGNALAVAGLIFAAGIFTGILSGTKMVDAMAGTVTAMISPAVGPFMAPITALLSIPFTFFISNDAFYFGVLPILAESAASYGLDAGSMARASLVGQQVHLLSPLVPSTYLLVGMAGVELGDHQRFTLKWALGSCLVMLLVGLLSGAFPLVAR